MISYGKSIRQSNDKLNKVKLEQIASRIKKPKLEMRNFIDQLRTVASIDKNQYRNLKVQLPYFVAAIFNPPFRKNENFAYTEYFILDIDHLGDKEILVDDLMNKFSKDNRILLAFRSPSNDGIKAFFKFSEKVYDVGKYSMFYKAFAQKFAMEYSLQQYIDKRTSDVSRACFYSYDEKQIYNPNADTISMNSIINFDNELELLEVQRDIKEYSKGQQKPDDLQAMKQVLPKDLLQEIRETLNPKVKERREKKVFVPEQLEQILDDIKEKLLSHNIETKEVRNINYGKQFKFGVKYLWTEINLFYGKKGFTIVITNKSGSNEELGVIVENLIYELLYGSEKEEEERNEFCGENAPFT